MLDNEKRRGTVLDMSKPKMTKARSAPESEARTMTGIRLDPEAIARLDAIAAHDEARTGFRPSRSDVLRGCLAIGIAVREREAKGGKR